MHIRNLVLMSLVTLTLVAMPLCAEEFWFATIADTHITDEAGAELVAEAIAMINADERIEFSLWLGDITDKSTEPEFIIARRTLELNEKPWYPVRGNHDDRGGYYEQYFGELNYRVEHAGWVFLMMDSNGPIEKLVTEETMQWLRDELATIDPETPIVLACHHPLILGGIVPLAGAPAILELFKNHNLKAVVNGHLHTNQEHVVDGVLHTVNACAALIRGNIDRDPRRGYRIYHVKDGEITTEFVAVREVD